MDDVYEQIIWKDISELMPLIEKTSGRSKWISELNHDFCVHTLYVKNFRIEFLYNIKDLNNPTYDISTPDYVKVIEEFKNGNERVIGIHVVEKCGYIKPYNTYYPI